MTLADRIAQLVEQHGSLRAAARVLNTDPGYLSRLASGEKDDPGETLLRRMGLRQVVSYELSRASLGATPAAPSDARDAERYRWLREYYVEPYGWHGNPPGWPEGKFRNDMPVFSARMLHGLDAAIDAALSPSLREQQEGKQPEQSHLSAPGGLPVGVMRSGEKSERSAMEQAERICRDVAELPDRNSPEDWPEAMLVTHSELQEIVCTALAGDGAASLGVPLTDEQIVENCGAIDLGHPDWVTQVARAVERAHGIGAPSSVSPPPIERQT